MRSICYTGALARFVIGPLDVLKIRFQVQLEPIREAAAGSSQRLSKYTGVGQALRLIVKEEGVQVSRSWDSASCKSMPKSLATMNLMHRMLNDMMIKHIRGDLRLTIKKM